MYHQTESGQDEKLVDNINALNITASHDRTILQIELLITSQEAIATQAEQYYFAGKKYVAADKRLYRVWQDVVELP